MFLKFKEKYIKTPEPVKATLWYTACNILNKSVALLSTPIFTRIMSEKQYGTYAVFQSWYSIILIFTSLNIFMGGYQKGLLLFKNDIKEFTSSQLGLTSLGTIIWGCIYLVGVRLWTPILELSPFLMAAMFLELFFMPALEFWAASERFEFRYKKYVLVSLLVTIISLTLGIIAVINTSYKVEARVFSDVGVKVAFSFVLFAIIFKDNRHLYNKKYWKYALTFNIPLIPHYLSNYVLNQSDRIMIGKMIGVDKAAFYSVAYTISTVMILVVSALNNSLTPYIYKKINEYENNIITEKSLEFTIKKLTNPLLILVSGLCIVTMAFAPEIVSLFAGEKYSEAIYVIPPIAASVFFIFLYAMFSTIEYYFQKTKAIAFATTICAVLNLGLNYIFINKYGYYAAGYTTIICYICLSAFHYFFYRKSIKKIIEKDIYDIKSIVLFSLITIAFMILMVVTYDYLYVRYIVLIIILGIAIICRRQIINSLFNSERHTK